MLVLKIQSGQLAAQQTVMQKKWIENYLFLMKIWFFGGGACQLRARYFPAAKRGAILFFVLGSLSAINNMYEYSLNSFLEVFLIALATSQRAVTVDGRLKNIIDALTYDLYSYTCTGLFEKHKLMLSFQMTIRIIDGDGLLNHVHLDFFLKGNLSLEKAVQQNPFPEWFPDQGWQDLIRMMELGPQFAAVGLHFETHESEWQAW